MRRRSETETRDPPKIRSSSVRGFNGARSNVEIQVKFMDPDSECQPNVRPDEPAVLNEPTRDLAWISEKLKNIRDNSKSSFLIEKRRPITKSLFLSPLANASTNSGVAVGCILECFNEDFSRLDQAIIIIPSDFLLTSYNAEGANIVDKGSDKDMRSPFSVEKVIPIDLSFLFSPLGGASKTSGSERLDGVFSGKRKRLRQWVANTSFPNTEESCSKGCDLVSVLINRLFPDTAENNAESSACQCCRNEKPRQMRTETKFSSYAFPELDTCDKDCHWTPQRDLLETEYGCYSDDVCNRSAENLEIVPSEWDTKGCDAPLTRHASRSHFQFGKDCHWTPRRDLLETEYGCYSDDVCNRSAENLEIVPSEWDTKGCDAPLTRHASRSHFQFGKDCHWTPRRDLLETEYGCYSDDVCNRSAENLEIVPSEWDTKVCDAPLTRHAARSHFQFGKKKFRADFECDTPSMITIQDPYFCSNVENYESTASRHIKGLNDFRGMDESANGRGPSTLLLGWDVDSCEDQGVLCITKRNAEMNYTMAASWDDHQQSLDNCSVESELDTSSFLISYPFQFTSLPHPHSAPFSNVNEEKFLLAELKHFPLSLPCTSTCHNLLKDCDTYDTCDGSSTFSPLNHQWVLSKVFSEKHHRDMEPFLHPSGLGFDLGWMHLSISSFSDLYSPSYEGSQSLSKESPCSYLLTEEQHEDCFYSSNHSQNIPHFSEDTLNNHECFSTNSWIPIDKEMSTPVLLNSSSWLRTEEDIYYDDGERIYI
ncbi:hypothetical protein RHGRI_035915 [Rhododendron griersonianum]|uniref:Uncharacterized protein n=1 Tax=Rhododendron griersonianum TaxID=479676 RepID=A0AAV6HQ28_9ERIC|nr:hypothetical protein RHGRI_035915 [Rhododendron griersonianum]